MKYRLLIISAMTVLVPGIVFAQGQDAWSLWDYIFKLIGRLIELGWIITVLTFLWGLVQFMRQADNEGKRKEARQMMIGSIVAFFIAVSFWGLVTYTIRAFNFSPDREQDIPLTTAR